MATPAPEPAPGVFPDGGLPGASAEAAAGASADGSAAGAGMPVSPLVSPVPESAPIVYSDGGPSGVSTGAAAHTARDSVHSRHQSPPRRHIPAAVRRQIWLRDGGRCCYRDPLSGRRCTSSYLLQIDHLLPVAQGGGPNLFNLHLLLCPSQLAPRPRVGCAAGTPHVAAPPRYWRAGRLGSPTACRWTWPGGTPFVSPRAERASSLPHHQILAVVSRLRTSAPGDRHQRQRSALQHR